MISRWTRVLRHPFAGVVGHSAFVFGGRLAGAAAAYFTQVALARWMGAAELGVYVYAFSWCILLSIVTTFGYPAAAVRFIGAARAHEDHGTVHGFVRQSRQVSLGFGLVVALAAIGGLWVARDSLPPGYFWPLTLAMAAVPVFGWLNMEGAIAQSFRWFGLFVLPNVVLRPVLLLAAIALWFAAYGTLSAGIAMGLHLGLMVALALVTWWLVRRALARALPVAPHRRETAQWMQTGAPLILITLFGHYFADFHILAAGSFLDAAELAVFSTSFRTAFLIAFLLKAVDVVITPTASGLIASGEREALQRLVTRSTQLKFLGALPAAAILVVAGKPVLALFGADFVAGYEALVILTTSMLVLAAVGPVTELLSISGHQRECLRALVWIVAATLAINAVLTPTFGVNGAAWSVLIVVLIYAGWMLRLVRRHLGIVPALIGRTAGEVRPDMA